MHLTDGLGIEFTAA